MNITFTFVLISILLKQVQNKQLRKSKKFLKKITDTDSLKKRNEY